MVSAVETLQQSGQDFCCIRWKSGTRGKKYVPVPPSRGFYLRSCGVELNMKVASWGSGQISASQPHPFDNGVVEDAGGKPPLGIKLPRTESGIQLPAVIEHHLPEADS
jgi:hypothetical protein